MDVLRWGVDDGQIKLGISLDACFGSLWLWHAGDANFLETPMHFLFDYDLSAFFLGISIHYPKRNYIGVSR